MHLKFIDFTHSKKRTHITAFVVASLLVYYSFSLQSQVLYEAVGVQKFSLEYGDEVTLHIQNSKTFHSEGNTATTREKPLLVMHLGPNKSGTTFIQTLLSNPEPRKILEQDNYLYLGTCPREIFFENCVIVI